MPRKKPKHGKVRHWMHGSRIGDKHGYKKVTLKEYDIKEMDEWLDYEWLTEGKIPIEEKEDEKA